LYQILQKYTVLSCHQAAYPWMSSLSLNVFSIFSEKLCHTATLSFSAFIKLHFPTCLILTQKNKTYMSIKTGPKSMLSTFLQLRN
jgi:hypothetical protein